MPTENMTATPKSAQPDTSSKTCSTDNAKVAPSVNAPSAAKVEVKKDAAPAAPSPEQKK